MGVSTVILHGIPQFNGNGFDDWQFRVQMYMDSLGLMEVLTGDPPSNDAAKAIFLQNDKKAKERLVSMLHSDCFCYVRDKRTAKEMWSSLEAVFAKKSVISQLLLRKELAKLRMNDGDAMATFLLKFENLVRKLKLTGANLDENDVLTQLFLALPERYDPLVTALQNLDDGKLSVSVAKERLIAEETKMKDRVMEKNLPEMSAFQGKKKWQFNGKCFKCGKGGH